MNNMRRKIRYWLSLDNFFDTHQEWHACVEGFAEGFTIGRERYEICDGKDTPLKTDLDSEHHYYVSGRALGFAVRVVFLTGMGIWAVTSIIEVI